MQVREEPLIATNLVVAEEVIPHADWFKPALNLRRELIKEDVYYTNTVIFTVEDVEEDPTHGKYTYYIALDPIMGDDLVLNFRQEEILAALPALYVRCTEIDQLEEAYELIRTYASENDIQLEGPFYHVCFDAFDRAVIEVFIAIKEEEKGLMKWFKKWL
ncbi:DUF5085 family protein [Sporosarcina sp. Marseille-Q4063]|uniref:DUF5085 family protein n=1 Tax=Sporosarcina sp. Marseille-Q4063 TaxID=2810514 RepID=UPI001BB047BD|nr:DUF5085 family protein [Sporosarcina sp. Marseille-Q4063]QUW20801.1 DUF5085 family protein [Sporosarcina sp. Marseille-Q4063]